MKKALAAAIAVFCVTNAFAADTDIHPDEPGKNFEQKKAEILKHIEQKIVRDQEERACVQSATSHDGLRACRETFRPGPQRGDRPQHREK